MLHRAIVPDGDCPRMPAQPALHFRNTDLIEKISEKRGTVLLVQSVETRRIGLIHEKNLLTCCRVHLHHRMPGRWSCRAKLGGTGCRRAFGDIVHRLEPAKHSLNRLRQTAPDYSHISE